MKKKNPKQNFEFELYLKVKVKSEDLLSAVRKTRTIIKEIKDKDIIIEDVEVLDI